MWLHDEGHLTRRSHLPVTQLNFGGIDGRRGRVARFQLGPLYCAGDARSAREEVAQAAPESCADLWKQGVTHVILLSLQITKNKNHQWNGQKRNCDTA